jgi:hypothetical protein
LLLLGGFSFSFDLVDTNLIASSTTVAFVSNFRCSSILYDQLPAHAPTRLAEVVHILTRPPAAPVEPTSLPEAAEPVNPLNVPYIR